MEYNRISIPSVKSDLFSSSILSIVIVCILAVVFHLYGHASKIDSGMTSMFGAILAFSGLMTKQYLLKENIQYLHKWKKIESIINEIISHPSDGSIQTTGISNKLEKQNNLTKKYMEYVVNEIKIIPVIPLLLVVFYGAALIASEAQWFSLTCLAIMIFFVSYLAQATITSNNLAIDTTDLDKTISELEEIVVILKER